jgi:hypothetical protein
MELTVEMFFKTFDRHFLYKVSGTKEFAQTHAQVPYIIDIDGVTRVYFGTRDSKGRTRPTYFDMNSDLKVTYEHDSPIMSLGELGTFDEDGVMPSCFLKIDNKIYMYYTGWNRSETASYRLAIGLAVSTDKGNTFSRVHKGPLLDRNANDVVWVAQPHVIHENGIFKMWYLSCDEMTVVDNRPEPLYKVKYSESQDGVNWVREGKVCIDLNYSCTDAIGRPNVFKMQNKYYMLHSNRSSKSYRTLANSAYRLVLSSSEDGVTWKKEMDPVLPKPSDGWDSVMNEYSTTLQTQNDQFLVLHNGNGFGQSGIGYFKLKFTP